MTKLVSGALTGLSRALICSRLRNAIMSFCVAVESDESGITADLRLDDAFAQILFTQVQFLYISS